MRTLLVLLRGCASYHPPSSKLCGGHASACGALASGLQPLLPPPPPPHVLHLLTSLPCLRPCPHHSWQQHLWLHVGEESGWHPRPLHLILLPLKDLDRLVLVVVLNEVSQEKFPFPMLD